MEVVMTGLWGYLTWQEVDVEEVPDPPPDVDSAAEGEEEVDVHNTDPPEALQPPAETLQRVL